MNPIEIKTVLAQINESGRILNQSEKKFLKTMKELIKEGRYCSTNQANWLMDLQEYAKTGLRTRFVERFR